MFEKEDKRPFGVDLSHLIYLLFGFFGSMLLLFFFVVVLTSIDEGQSDYLGKLFLFAVIICCMWVINYGLSKRKSWIVSFILVYSVISFIHSFLIVIEVGPETNYWILLKSFRLLLAIFFGFQLIIFSRKETKEYFKNNVKTIVA